MQFLRSSCPPSGRVKGEVFPTLQLSLMSLLPSLLPSVTQGKWKRTSIFWLLLLMSCGCTPSAASSVGSSVPGACFGKPVLVPSLVLPKSGIPRAFVVHGLYMGAVWSSL